MYLTICHKSNILDSLRYIIHHHILSCFFFVFNTFFVYRNHNNLRLFWKFVQNFVVWKCTFFVCLYSFFVYSDPRPNLSYKVIWYHLYNRWNDCNWRKKNFFSKDGTFYYYLACHFLIFLKIIPPIFRDFCFIFGLRVLNTTVKISTKN